MALLAQATSLCEQPHWYACWLWNRGRTWVGLVLATMTLSYGLTLLAGPVVGGTAYYPTHALTYRRPLVPMVFRFSGSCSLDKLSWNLDGMYFRPIVRRLAIANPLEFQHPGWRRSSSPASRQSLLWFTHHRFADLVGRRTHLPIVGGPPTTRAGEFRATLTGPVHRNSRHGAVGLRVLCLK